MNRLLLVGMFLFLVNSICYAECPAYSPGVNTGATPTGPSDTGPFIDRFGNTTSYSITNPRVNDQSNSDI